MGGDCLKIVDGELDWDHIQRDWEGYCWLGWCWGGGKRGVVNSRCIGKSQEGWLREIREEPLKAVVGSPLIGKLSIMGVPN